MIERLIEQAILQILTPIFDPGFSESSFGFRPKRSAQDAARQVQAHIRSGYRHCIDMDLAKFFDKVQHDVLMVRVARKVHDRRLLKLIGRYLRAGVMIDTELHPSIEGTMQGGPLSPILANILLDDFDKELESRGLHFVRYADDFLVFTKTSEAAQRVARSIESYLTRKLRLVVNHQKSRICGTDGVEFLGFSFVGYGGNFRVSPKNQTKFKDRVREITRRNRGVSMPDRLLELRRYFQGWVGYFSLVPMKTYFEILDKWVRRRIRSCYWKQWRNPRTRIANLRKLGVRRDQAVTHGFSSKGAWVMSSSQAVHEALSIAYQRMSEDLHLGGMSKRTHDHDFPSQPSSQQHCITRERGLIRPHNVPRHSVAGILAADHRGIMTNAPRIHSPHDSEKPVAQKRFPSAASRCNTTGLLEQMP